MVVQEVHWSSQSLISLMSMRICWPKLMDLSQTRSCMTVILNLSWYVWCISLIVIRCLRAVVLKLCAGSHLISLSFPVWVPKFYLKHLNYFNNYSIFQQTSTTFSIRNRNQFSMQVERVEKFDLMANLTPVIIPIFWVEDAVDLPAEVTNIIKYGIYL